MAITTHGNGGETRFFIPALGGVYENLVAAGIPWLIVRVAAGALLIPHGYLKLFAGGLGGTIQFFQKLGLEPAAALATYIGCLEFFGGILLAIGLLTRPVALLVLGFMAVAVVKVHGPNGYLWTKGGFEYPLMWGLLALALLIGGGGPWSVDRKLGREF
jgi:putative oxidoreductase